MTSNSMCIHYYINNNCMYALTGPVCVEAAAAIRIDQSRTFYFYTLKHLFRLGVGSTCAYVLSYIYCRTVRVIKYRVCAKGVRRNL